MADRRARNVWIQSATKDESNRSAGACVHLRMIIRSYSHGFRAGVIISTAWPRTAQISATRAPANYSQPLHTLVLEQQCSASYKRLTEGRMQDCGNGRRIFPDLWPALFGWPSLWVNSLNCPQQVSQLEQLSLSSLLERIMSSDPWVTRWRQIYRMRVAALPQC